MELVLRAENEELLYRFLRLGTSKDLAELLEISYDQLVYQLYKVPDSEKYTEFLLRKRRGGFRKISAPISSLKIIQQKLNYILQNVYDAKSPVHSFIADKGIVTNAEVHVGQKYVFNVDLKNFFPSIHFGRVRGLFTSPPYELPEDVAQFLAQICCFDNQLPQGAPTSPIISNMICVKMDKLLEGLAKHEKCYYTRYADDITFSTSKAEFPRTVAYITPQGTVEVGEELSKIIKENGFDVNKSKIRLQTRRSRQSVTGVTVNVKPNVKRKYVRQIRAMLHAWQKYGLEAAEEEFRKRYDRKHRLPQKDKPSFKQVVKGKIEFLGMVRGKDDPIYLQFCEALSALAPEFSTREKRPYQESKLNTVYVWTEGKTDWKHLEAALKWWQSRRHFEDIDVRFLGKEDDRGDDDLLKMCEHYSRIGHDEPHIFIFDRDKLDTVKKVLDEKLTYKGWGNNVFSFAIPVPSHRKDTPEVCLELYYKDDEIKCQDENGRRLFLSNEFSNRSGKLLTNKTINCVTLDKLRNPQKLKIIDDHVLDENDINIALPKNHFAAYILNKVGFFGNFDFSEFKLILDIIRSISKIKAT